MLKFIRRGQRWVTALFVVAIGGAFVFFIGLGGPLTGPSGGALIEVGPYRFGLREFERSRAQREQSFQEQLGDQYDAKAVEDMLIDLAARDLIDRAVMALAAQDLGIAVAKREVERSVLTVPAFRDEQGRFDAERFENWAQWEYGSQRNFLREERMGLQAAKFYRLLLGEARVSEGEAREAVRMRLEGVRIAFAVVDPSDPPEDLEIGEEEVAAFLESREPEARAAYDERSEEFNVPEQVRARHILVRVEPGASDEAKAGLRAEAESILQRLREGESFEALAEEHSDDPGSRENGGDLGFFKRGQMLQPFQDAAFALEPGALGEVLESDFGFHVIRTEEHRAAEHRSYEEVRDQLARELIARQAAAEVAFTMAERIAQAIRDGESLETAARREELTLQRSGWLQRRPDGFVPGLGAAPEVLAMAFALPAETSSDRIFEVGDKRVLVAVLERSEPEAKAIEAEVEAERERLLQEKRRSQSDTWISARRAQLAEHGELRIDLSSIR
jgi:peptidyl-prolyl cis-trans isomerase D